jgi:hypothetical protein
VRTVCCYEAGYDGFWLHRVLVNHGIENHVLDAASLPIDRRAKHIKTDNIDAKRLLSDCGLRAGRSAKLPRCRTVSHSSSPPGPDFILLDAEQPLPLPASPICDARLA